MSKNTNISSSVSGCIDFKMVSIPDFKPITEITNTDLQSWVEDRVGIEKINTMKTNLEAQINNLSNDWNPIPNA